MIDNSPPPVPTVADQGDYINTEQILEAHWIFTHEDPESGTSYEWAITESPEINSPVLWQETDDKKVILDAFEHLHEHTYYFCVRATNGAGLTSTGMSNGIMVDATAPYLPEVRIQDAINLGDPDTEDLTYITQTDSLGLWIQSQDPQSPVDGYIYRWGTLDTIEEKEKIFSSTPQIILENPDIPGGQVTYFSAECTNQALLVSGTGYSKGVVVDTEAPVIANVFGYIDSNTLVFVWDVIPSVSPVINYEVALVAASAVASPPDTWINVDTRRSIVFDSTPLSDGTYHLIVRGCNAAGTWSRRDGSHDEWGVSTPVVLDRTPPVISSVSCQTPYASDEVRITMTAQDTLSGIRMAYYALGTETDIFAFSDGWLEQECDNGISEFLIPGTMFPHNSKVVFTVMVKDNCGLFSTIVRSDIIVIDKTPPETFSVVGPVWTQSADEITGISFSSFDEESGIARYEIHITGEPGEIPVYAAENILSGFTGSISGFTLIEGGLYYIGVRTENRAGLWSAMDYSEAFRVDTLPPVVTFTDTGPLVINTPPGVCSFNVTEESRVFISYDTPGGTTVSWENNCTPGTTSYTFGETDPASYILTAYAVDPAGNRGPNTELTIRINAPPVVVLPSERYIAIGEPAVFEPIVSDPDGYPALYAWDFGDTGYSALESPVHTYTEKGEYTLTLSVTDNDGLITTATMQIVVGNTTEGEMYVDQVWSGIHRMTGDVTVPSGRMLTILPGTRIIVDTVAGRNDYFHALIIEGTLLTEGETESITFTSPLNQTGAWQGIVVTGSAELNSVEIFYAQRSISVLDTAQAVITNCLFEDNETGIHVYNAAPTIKSSTFRNNKWYGIKEDNGAMPLVIECLFIANRRHYYHHSETSITIDRLNTIENNSGNREE